VITTGSTLHGHVGNQLEHLTFGHNADAVLVMGRDDGRM